jgi:hypothetical protein
MYRIRPHLRIASVVLALPLAFGACAPSVAPSTPTGVTTASAAAPSPTLGSPTLPPASPSASLPQASPTLEPISLARLGTEGWILITSDTNSPPIPITKILGNVKLNFGFVFTCIGEGDARVSITATNSKMMANPGSTPLQAVSWMGHCPTTENVTDLTGRFDSGGYSLSPSVDVPEGVTYLLLVGTLPN